MRDLQKDLELCNAATPEPWVSSNSDRIYWSKGYYVATVRRLFTPDGLADDTATTNANRQFIAEARSGWPEAIKRAMEAEARVKELRWALHELLYAGQCDVCVLDVNGGCRLGLGKETCIKLAREQARQQLHGEERTSREG